MSTTWQVTVQTVKQTIVFQGVNTGDQHTRNSRKTRHWVYKWSKPHMTSETAIHAVKLMLP